MTDPEDEYLEYEQPRVYKFPVCRGSNSKNMPEAWKGRKRKCPCCGRMIYSKMEFTLHGNQTGNNNK